MRLTKKLMWQIVIELWEWLAEDGSRRKMGWPGWEKYGDMRAHCPLCEYGFRNLKRYDRLVCGRCPIWNCSEDFAFGRWTRAKTKTDRKKYAGLFLEQLKEVRDRCQKDIANTVNLI